MCTLIIDWRPGEFIVGANRDENLDRPSEGFAWRGDIFCPLDVRGGTWIGINKAGLFVGLTNLDIRDESQPEIKRLTRGAIPMAALAEDNAMDAAEAVEQLLETGLYYPFNLLIADQFSLLSLAHDPYTKANIGLIKPLEEGLHVATSWGIDTWRVPRCCYIKWAWERKDKLEDILAYHGDGSVDTAVCVHDSKESHQTRSSCIIRVRGGCCSVSVEHIDGPACVGRVLADKGIIDIDAPLPKARVIRDLKWETEKWEESVDDAIAKATSLLSKYGNILGKFLPAKTYPVFSDEQIAELLKMAREGYNGPGYLENNPNLFKRTLVEAKVLIDRNNLATNMFLLNPNLEPRLNRLIKEGDATPYTARPAGKAAGIWGADIYLDDRLPPHSVLAICYEPAPPACGEITERHVSFAQCITNEEWTMREALE